MSRSENLESKWRAQSSKILGEDVRAASMIVPPGSSLYKSYSPNKKALALGGPIFEAFLSKSQGGADGAAGKMPRQMGILAVTDTSLVFLKKKKLGTAPAEVLASWPLDDVNLELEEHEKWSYPGMLLNFSDGTNCVVMGEKRWPFAELATAANR